AQQAQIACLLEQLAHREAAVFFPFFDVRVDLFLDEILDGAALLFVFLSELHCCCPSCRVLLERMSRIHARTTYVVWIYEVGFRITRRCNTLLYALDVH